MGHQADATCMTEEASEHSTPTQQTDQDDSLHAEEEIPTMRLTFQEQDFCVFPSPHDETPTVYMDTSSKDTGAEDALVGVPAPELHIDPGVFWEPLDSLFAALRVTDALGEFLEEGTELCLAFPDLELVLHEDNVYAREISLHDISQLALGFGYHGSLHVLVTETPRFISQYNALAMMMSGAADDDNEAAEDEWKDGQMDEVEAEEEDVDEDDKAEDGQVDEDESGDDDEADQADDSQVDEDDPGDDDEADQADDSQVDEDDPGDDDEADQADDSQVDEDDPGDDDEADQAEDGQVGEDDPGANDEVDQAEDGQVDEGEPDANDEADQAEDDQVDGDNVSEAGKNKMVGQTKESLHKEADDVHATYSGDEAVHREEAEDADKTTNAADENDAGSVNHDATASNVPFAETIGHAVDAETRPSNGPVRNDLESIDVEQSPSHVDDNIEETTVGHTRTGENLDANYDKHSTFENGLDHGCNARHSHDANVTDNNKACDEKPRDTLADAVVSCPIPRANDSGRAGESTNYDTSTPMSPSPSKAESVDQHRPASSPFTSVTYDDTSIRHTSSSSIEQRHHIQHTSVYDDGQLVHEHDVYSAHPSNANGSVLYDEYDQAVYEDDEPIHGASQPHSKRSAVPENGSPSVSLPKRPKTS
ncbi:hypothetical protein MGL_3515 [Malassezia globosa CBS 7966]|uniref:Uncharacterized protein n=1 Tax=Malassezia globosa (strain ATCC MYA-4612 / CBS 7966) TaxID=425265 RepID=A8Q9N2_MALGO|nr:uncharacterized protein MGL_3515 [Malassezia globosa CBS 7966]EDP42266.1 hypothetical protein MGL_3515 [Malassezia globosa CBS 7966]